MGKKKLTNGEISALCMEMALLLHAGLGMADGIHSLLESADADTAALLKAVSEELDAGEPLSVSMRASGVFPDEVCSLTEVGEHSGRTEEALRALSDSYEAKQSLEERIRSALLYPSVLLLLMLVVIGVLLTKVLPVFNDVFTSLGGELTGLAGGLLKLGQVLDSAMPILLVLLVAIALTLATFAASPSFREKLMRTWRVHHGNKGISLKVTMARFAQALAMGIRSGLPVEESLELASSFHGDNAVLAARCRDAFSRLQQGEGLAEALRDAGVLPGVYCRMLALGIRSGTGDTVITEIARRMEEESERAIEERVGQVEPTLVIVTSILVGVILLSVMLPLMNIMAAIG